MNKRIRIGTRESKLAVAQAELVAASIRQNCPEAEIELVLIKTTGDKLLDKTLDKIGGKGVFVKELDEALLRGNVDICVHSYKDIPVLDNPALPIVAVSQREDPRDVLILPQGSKSIDPEKPIGCSSLRRCIQLERLFPGVATAPVRGNIHTRLAKLDKGEYAALVLAAAGLLRVGLQERISRFFTPEEMLPAGCQGAIAVQGRAGEDHSYLQSYHDREGMDTTTAERGFIRRLGLGCGAPIGVYAQLDGEQLRVRGMIAAPVPRYEEIRGDRASAEALGRQLAEKCLSQSEGEVKNGG